MIKSSISTRRLALLGATAPLAVLAANPAYAQAVTTGQATTTQVGSTADQTPDSTVANPGNDIVVTGTILRTTSATPSPVTVLSAENLDQRGINTVQDAIQQLSSNNGPALTNSFTANGAFAGGASAVSLRGLSTNSTLVLFDGLRAAYYPLADDGSRNFVDLNTVPDDIVDRIEVLRDGASSSYGADAIAGVVNIITRRQFNGVSGRAEAGISERGFGANQRLSLTVGHGDLSTDGYNAYVSGFYYHADAVYNRDLRYPFSSDNYTGVCQGTNCGPNNTVGSPSNVTPTSANFLVRPYDPTNTALIGGARYTNLNLANCIGTVVTATAADLATASAPLQRCNVDYTNQYGVVSPRITRFGASARVTANLGTSEAYLELNFQQSRSEYTGFPATVRGLAPTGINFPQFATDRAASATTAAGTGILALPIYVCPRNGQSAVLVNGVATLPGGCSVATPGATLNPNNPFAAAGQVARIIGRDLQSTTDNETRSRVYRAAFGIHGTVFGDWDYRVDATAMHTDLRQNRNGYVYIQHLLDVVADGTYNFVNPSLNSAAVNNYLKPESRIDDSSDLYQAQVTIGHNLFELPGGPLQLGVGGSVYYEAVDAPSGNPDYNGPTQRYFTLNAFGTTGHRTVASAFGELNAPILRQLEVNLSGRYDHYSSGQSAFSPKAGIKFTPIRQVVLRGTYSRGFRIPSFGEANALPTTGYVTQSVSTIPVAFRAQYGAACAANPANCPTYLTSYSIGLTTLASPNLRPERSRSFTAGILIEPIRNVSFTVDYYNIRKTGAITTPDNSPAIAAYYAGTAIPVGFTVIPDAPDVNNPLARPRIAFVQSQLINANTIRSEGIDFGASFRHNFGAFRFTSNLDASLILKLNTTIGGDTQDYVDTLGNFNLTAGTGTFRWRGNWQNTFEYGPFALTGTVNYTSGYDLSATDQGCDYHDSCFATPYNGPRVKSFITADFNMSVNVNDHFTFYFNVLNAFDRSPGIDLVTYGANAYNAVQVGNNIYGRQFRGGARFRF